MIVAALHLRGHIIIWDDGTLQPLSSTLHHVTNITGVYNLCVCVCFFVC